MQKIRLGDINISIDPTVHVVVFGNIFSDYKGLYSKIPNEYLDMTVNNLVVMENGEITIVLQDIW